MKSIRLECCVENNQTQPSVFMTDDSTAERQALQEVFPESTLLFCAFHVCQSIWRWLCDTKHDVAKNERQLFMIKFRNILFEFNEDEANKNLNDLCANENEKFSNLMKKYQKGLKNGQYVIGRIYLLMVITQIIF